MKRAARSVGATITIVLDVVRVIEYLWRAAYAFHTDGTIGAERWVENQLLKLLAGASGGAVAKEYERNHKSRYADGEVPNPLPAPHARPSLKLV